VLQILDLFWRVLIRRFVNPIQVLKVASNTLFQMFDTRLEFVVSKILVPVINSFELAAIYSNGALRQQIEPPTQKDKLAAYLLNGGAVVLPEIGNGFEIRTETTSEPNELKVALRFTLQSSTTRSSVFIWKCVAPIHALSAPN
tara:strand:+ start:1669 stop:2097 length:429 start_codon:yes stop_codon:yes gene_type:complete